MAHDKSHDKSSDGRETVGKPELEPESRRPRTPDGSAPTFNSQELIVQISSAPFLETIVPNWQSLYAAALGETAALAIPMRIAEAESAILRRMKQIFYSAEYVMERREIEDAWETLAQQKLSCATSGTDSPRPSSSVSTNKQAAA
jgi:hypothetical protein